MKEIPIYPTNLAMTNADLFPFKRQTNRYFITKYLFVQFSKKMMSRWRHVTNFEFFIYMYDMNCVNCLDSKYVPRIQTLKHGTKNAKDDHVSTVGILLPWRYSRYLYAMADVQMLG